MLGKNLNTYFQANLGDEFLEALSSVISEPKFYQDYIKLFPLGDDLDIFNQAGLLLAIRIGS